MDASSTWNSIFDNYEPFHDMLLFVLPNCKYSPCHYDTIEVMSFTASFFCLP